MKFVISSCVKRTKVVIKKQAMMAKNFFDGAIVGTTPIPKPEDD